MDDFEWLVKHIKELNDLGKNCLSFDCTTSNDFGYLTALKLCVIQYYINYYTRILDKDRVNTLGYNGLAYIDVFAGSGINYIGDSKTPLIGSFPMAATCHFKNTPFDYFFAVERNPAFCKSLFKRMNGFVDSNKFEITEGLAEDAIPSILERIDSEGLMYLAFIDFEGVKGFSLKALQSLMKMKGDLWITFIPSASRCLGRAKAGMKDSETLAQAYGEGAMESKDVDELKCSYIDNIRKTKQNIREIHVSSGSSYSYDMIFAANESQSGSGFVKGVEPIKKRIESLNGEYVKKAIEQIEGRIRPIFSY